MKLILHILLAIASNIAAFLAADYFVDGVTVTRSVQELLYLGMLFGLLNLFLKPFMKIVLSPLILLTFGLFIIIINATILHLTDELSVAVAISGIPALALATIIVSVVNGLLHFIVKRFHA
jgi:putative membrane protein